MSAHVSDTAFHAAGNIDQTFVIFTGFVQILQLRRGFECLFQWDIFPLNRPRDCFCNAVNLNQRDIHHPPHITHSATGCHGTKSDDLGYFIRPIFLIAVFHYLSPAVILKVQIDIRHGQAVRVEKTFEQKIETQRLYRSDIQGKSNQ